MPTTRREFLKQALATVAVVLFGPMPRVSGALDSDISQGGGSVSPEALERFLSCFEDTWGEVSVPWTVVMRPELWEEIQQMEGLACLS